MGWGVNQGWEPSLLPHITSQNPQSQVAGGSLGIHIPSSSWNKGNHCVPMSLSSPTPRTMSQDYLGSLPLSSGPQARTCVSPGPFLHPECQASWLLAFSSWSGSKCWQYDFGNASMACVDFSYLNISKMLFQKNKQRPESIKSSSQYR